MTFRTISWDTRKPASAGGSVIALADAAGTTLATATASQGSEDDAITIGEQSWNLTCSEQELSATSGADKMTATIADGKKWSRTKRVAVSCCGRTYTIINEQSNDWIIDDALGEKLAQFTGRNRGVRHAALDFEPAHEPCPTSDEAFLALVSRRLLEARLVGFTWPLTLSLLIVAPLAILWYLY